MKKNYLSFGGGVNSVAMMLLLLDEGVEFEAVFADTGCERPETIGYIEYLKNNGHKITTIKKRGKFSSLYDECLAYSIVPSRKPAWCSINYKQEPLKAYYQKPCYEFIGIDAGESHRARLSSTGGVESRWPLIERDINRGKCIEIIKAHGLPVPVKSGCYICPNQTKKQWRTLRKDHPDLFCKALALEKLNIKYRTSKGKLPMYLSASRKPLEIIVQENQLELWEEMRPPCHCGL